MNQKSKSWGVTCRVYRQHKPENWLRQVWMKEKHRKELGLGMVWGMKGGTDFLMQFVSENGWRWGLQQAYLKEAGISCEGNRYTSSGRGGIQTFISLSEDSLPGRSVIIPKPVLNSDTHESFQHTEDCYVYRGVTGLRPGRKKWSNRQKAWERKECSSWGHHRRTRNDLPNLREPARSFEVLPHTLGSCINIFIRHCILFKVVILYLLI